MDYEIVGPSNDNKKSAMRSSCKRLSSKVQESKKNEDASYVEFIWYRNHDEEVKIAQQVSFFAAELWRLFGGQNLDENELGHLGYFWMKLRYIVKKKWINLVEFGKSYLV
ncbi:hypothetical protein E3N88_00582 [Mikania micrantha]|uniref:Uncharacterized protein n=1 Tax=Mikania micrantha TaxID=192012 RepID=A0A5N6Q077_9ASTR|nr:hypothetical protein E3N88_00582 [Mikania micrantha]